MAMLETCGCGGFVPMHVEACPNCGAAIASTSVTSRRMGAVRRAAVAAAGSLLVMTVSACYGGAVQPRPAEPAPASDVAGNSSTTGDETGTEPALCDDTECGPRMGMPAEECSDGSIGGNTGRCLRHPDGSCGWEVRECP